MHSVLCTVWSITIPAIDARIPQHQQSFVASVNKLTANPPCYTSCLSRFSALQTIKQTNKHTGSATLHCNIMYSYCIFTEMNTVHNLISLLIHTSVSCAMTNSNDFIKKTGAKTLKARIHTNQKRVLSNPTRGCALLIIYNLYFYVQRLLYPGRICFRHSPSSKQTKNNISQSATPSERSRTLKAHTLASSPEVWRFTPPTGSLRVEWHLIWPIVASKKHRSVI